MKIVTVLGARPQFIKAALLSHELRKSNEETIIHTGQHYDREMSHVFFEEMEIPAPDYNLGIGSDTHAVQTAHIMMALEKIFVSETPGLVLVYGDTNSTLAAALTASKLNIPIAHVEAGPRMFDKTVPEEVNRIITDHISTLLFAPSAISINNLHKEGLNDSVFLTGDVMLDNFKYFSKIAEKHSNILENLNLSNKEYILTTVHRARNTDIIENLSSICKVLVALDEHTIVFPVHPRTVKFLKRHGFYEMLINAPNIKFIKPVSYLDMLILTKNAKKVITDSGGLQKEAYFAQVPCITLDDSTGWPETVQAGYNILATNNKTINSEKVIKIIKSFEPAGPKKNVFGNGKANKKIAKIINNFLT